ncbi:unnamed protein product [Rhizoctonia solani]|uniref:Uncharacterized protein n=1 Tax=Rhizoctonia solani TaxID=456999 RepID=A0A8H3H8J3_9AGAM|nr:unnamed protein product [Rhizoctonia solani]
MNSPRDAEQDRQMSDPDCASEDQSRADLVSTLHSSPKELAEKAWFYCDQFQQVGEPSDLEKAIECGTRALALTPDDHPDFPTRLADLAVFYNDRFEHLDELEDLDKAIAFESRALSLNNLGVSYANRFEYLGDLNDLEKSIEYSSLTGFGALIN